MIEDALETIGLNPAETLGRYPHQLSGGQRQRIMVARAFLLKPRVILADEPVSMIDASLRATILQSLRKLNQEFGISILYISHDLTTIYQICDHIIVLYRGSVAEIGDVEKVIKDPKHPYTKLLVESIPQPDPEKRWIRILLAFADHGSNEKNGGCKICSYLSLCHCGPVSNNAPSSVSRQSQPCRPLFSLPGLPPKFPARKWGRYWISSGHSSMSLPLAQEKLIPKLRVSNFTIQKFI